MADDKANRGPADRERINVHEDFELRYWSEKFGCTHDELKAAVKKAGVMANTSLQWSETMCHWRSPRDMMREGRSMRVFQA